MEEKDPILELNKKMIDATIPFEKLPNELRSLTHEHITLRRELSKESDRGRALLAAAHLDYMLEQLLRKKLLGNKDHMNSIFGFNGPLGTFSSRILLCYSIGLISKNTLFDIQIVRKIRNEFGHANKVISFSTPKIRDLTENFKHSQHKLANSPRQKFLAIVSRISGQLYGTKMKSEKFTEVAELKSNEEFVNKMIDFYKKFLDDALGE